MSIILTLSAQQLRQAADIKDKIESLQKELNRIFGSPAKAAATTAPKKQRTLSAAGRKKIAAAQRARWAKAKRKINAAPAQKPKRQMSAAARAKISAAAKARWAKIKAGTNSGKPVATIPQLMRRVNRMKRSTDKLERETNRKIKEAMTT